MKFPKYLYCILILLFFSIHLSAGTTGKIAGRVTDANNGEGLIGVNLYMEGTAFGATTDLEGYFVILNVPPGKHLLVVQYVGYQEQRFSNLSVSIDLTTKLEVQMAEHTLELEEAIVIVGERPLLQKDVTSSQSIVSAEEIDALPVTEMNDIIQLQAGVTKDHEGKFHIRGGRTTEIGYWVNGVAVTDAYDNSNGIEVDNSSIQELQVISGTFNAEYGNAMSGIINIVTKEGSPEYRGSIMAYADDYVSNNTDIFNHIDEYNPVVNHNIQGNLSGPIPGTNNKLTFFVNGRYNYSDGWLYGEKRYNTDGSWASDDTLLEVSNTSVPGRYRIERNNGDSTIYRIVPPMSGEEKAQNWNKRYQGQAKFAFHITPTIKLNVEGLYSKRDYQDYDHQYKYVPDGNVTKHFESFNNVWSLTHTVSSKSFYTVNASYFFRDFNEYLYEDPFDSRYLHPDTTRSEQPDNELQFRTKGTNLHRFFRETKTLTAKADFTSQISNQHLIRLGVETKFHELKVDDYTLQESRDHVVGEPFIPEIPLETATNRNKFNRKPYEFSGYIQDKIELDEVIINVGFRMDYFNSDANVLVNTEDPNINIPLRTGLDTLSIEEREPYFYKKASAKWQLSPRFGIAYPISATGVIHFSYGHFLQIPSFQYLFNRSDYKVSETGVMTDVYGNPDLEPQKTVMYEIGMKQEFANEFIVDITGFYRDVRDWISSQPYLTTTGALYSIYVNKDYSNVKGVTLTFKKRFSNFYSFNLNYTYQIAEGSNSSPEDDFNNIRDNREPAIFLLPMGWDQTHLFNFSVNLGGTDWGSSMIARYGTGLPYSPSITQYTSDRGISSRPQENSRRRPSQFVMDFKIYKLFNISGFIIKPFLNVFNVFDTKIVEEVFGDTGKADFTTEFQNRMDEPGVEEYLTRPWYYGPPRRIQFGIEWMF